MCIYIIIYMLPFYITSVFYNIIIIVIYAIICNVDLLNL